MKKILISLITIVAVSTLVVGATRAVFSGSTKFAGNTVGAAEVKIDARSEPMGLLPKPLNVKGLVPNQWTDWARGVIFNEQTSTDIRLYMYIANVSGEACDKINLKVYTGHAASGADSERGFLIYDGALNSFTGLGNRREITGFVFNPLMPPNNSAVIQQAAGLDALASDWYQGKSCTWDEVFVAETPVNPSPIPSP